MLVFIAFLILSAANADISQDEQLHMLASYGINSTFLLAGSSRLNAAGSTLMLGLLKEATDPEFEPRDMGANAVGIALSTLTTFVLEF
jgi:hypothetical protein